jgi:hypothetical protein
MNKKMLYKCIGITVAALSLILTASLILGRAAGPDERSTLADGGGDLEADGTKPAIV